MKFIILGGLCLLSYEDIQNQSVSIWQLMIFGIVCMGNVIKTGISMYEVSQGSLLGILFGTAVLMLLILTKQLGIGDGIVLFCLGLGLGGVAMMRIFLAAMFLMAVVSGILLLFGRISRKYEMPFIPFLFLSALGVILCV